MMKKYCEKCGKDITKEKVVDLHYNQGDPYETSNFFKFLPFNKDIAEITKKNLWLDIDRNDNLVTFKFTRRGLLKTDYNVSQRSCDEDLYISVDFNIGPNADFCFDHIKKAFKPFIKEVFNILLQGEDKR